MDDRQTCDATLHEVAQQLRLGFHDVSFRQPRSLPVAHSCGILQIVVRLSQSDCKSETSAETW